MLDGMPFQINLSNILEMLPMMKAALPYTLPPYCTGLDTIIKIIDALGALNSLKMRESAERQQGKYFTDTEALLCAVRECCPSHLTKLIDTVFNIVKAFRFYDTYKDIFMMMSAMSPEEAAGMAETFGEGSTFDMLKNMLN